MKILNLRFKNLNSLYGEWEIDFTSPEYVSNGIFVISGSTGAGKSTILDAICLALYGSTPRLNIISKSTNEIMSRQTGECFAEVTFKVNSGIYTCVWSQHRARKSADGKLSDSKHEISDSESGKILAIKKREVSNLVIEKTGMDLERFTRSILLAQGSFSAFLKATADERAPILEQITGTEIYSRISKKIHETQRSESEKLSLLLAETEGITLLKEEEKDKINIDLLSVEVEDKELSKKSKILSDFIVWKNNIDKLQAECKELFKSYNASLLDLDKFKQERDFLNKVNNATELDGEYSISKRLHRSQLEDNNNLKNIENELPKVILLQNNSRELYCNVEKKLDDLKKRYIVEQEVLKKVREIDYDIKQSSILLNEKGIEVSKSKSILEELKKALSSALIESQNIQDESSFVNEYLHNNHKHSELVLGFSGLKHLLNEYKIDSDDNYFKQIEMKKSNEQIITLQKVKNEIEQIHLVNLNVKETSISKLKSENEALVNVLNGKEIREYKAELKSLIREKSLLDKISSLEDERNKLIQGTACPLCGSKEHPYSKGFDANIDKIDISIKNLESLLDQIETIEIRIKNIETESNKINAIVLQTEKSLFEKTLELDEAVKGSLKLESQYKKTIEDSLSNKESIKSDLLKYSIDVGDIDDVDTLIKSLEEIVSLWQSYSLKSESFNSKIKDIEVRISRFKEDIESKNRDLEVKNSDLTNMKLNLNLLIKKREDSFGFKQPDIEDKKYKNEIDDLESEKNKISINNEKNGRHLVEIKTKKESLEHSIEVREKELIEIDIRLNISLTNLGFIDIDDFVKYRIPQIERVSLIEKANLLDSTFSNIATRKKDREQKLEVELNKNLTDRELLDLKEELNTITTKLRELGEHIGAMKQQLQGDSEAQLKVKDKQNDIELQKIEYENWQKIHSLIGSADGKKFRNFAQGLTFEQMVFYANRELVKLSDRYLLVRDKENPLELNVIDNYQAGEERSTKNLSGGESFIISLSLALGLSHMSSNKVRVDSLFLDEGFGTLDEEALETALNALSSLHQTGKLIGVISHISALKKRIITQINIEKNAGGRGSLTGPGCKQL